MKRLQIPPKLVYETFLRTKKRICTQNFSRTFIKNLLPEKRKENIKNKQMQFKSRLNDVFYWVIWLIAMKAYP